MRRVLLKLFEDDATGDWGIAHSNAIDRGFNAFWNGIGIFHDVFEHYFEERHKYFQGGYAFNVAGEIAAMGHMAYFVGHIGLRDERNLNPHYIYGMEHSIVHTTHDMLQEACSSGYSSFGNELLVRIPRQALDNAYYLESDIINEHCYEIQKLKQSKELPDDPDERGFAVSYKKSITAGKVQNLYRWGWKQAAKIARDRETSFDILADFLKTWERFTKSYKAQDLAYSFTHILFEIEDKGVPNWKAYFIAAEGNYKVPMSNIEDYIGIDYYEDGRETKLLQYEKMDAHCM